MKNLITSFLALALLTSSGIANASTINDFPEAKIPNSNLKFDINIEDHENSDASGSWHHYYLKITGLNDDPVQVLLVTVNRGSCNTSYWGGPVSPNRYGQTFTIRVNTVDCQIEEVKIMTTKGYAEFSKSE